jgi:hypothetical protein
MSLIWAGSISLDSTFKYEVEANCTVANIVNKLDSQNKSSGEDHSVSLRWKSFPVPPSFNTERLKRGGLC